MIFNNGIEYDLLTNSLIQMGYYLLEIVADDRFIQQGLQGDHRFKLDELKEYATIDHCRMKYYSDLEQKLGTVDIKDVQHSKISGWSFRTDGVTLIAKWDRSDPTLSKVDALEYYP